MLNYPNMVKQLCNKMGIPKEDSKKFNKMLNISEYLIIQDPDLKLPATKHRIKCIVAVNKADTYIEKQNIVDKYAELGKIQHRVEDRGFW